MSEKFFALCAIFGAENVGMLTGDASVNAGAPIVCCTAEVLANIALREGAGADVGQVVMDEFHYYADGQRGWAWQVPLLCLPAGAVPADVGDARRRQRDRHRPDAADGRARRWSSTTRSGPVPLTYSWSVEPLHELLEELVAVDQAPIYVVHFTQASAMERAQSLLSAKLCTREERDAIAEAIGAFRFTAGFGRTLSKLVRGGIGVHHAGMLPRYRRLVEQLAQTGLAEGDLRHRHARRRHQRPDPHRASSPAWRSTTAPATGCSRRASSIRSPDAPGGRGSTRPATSSCRRPST